MTQQPTPVGQWYFCLIHRRVEPYEACKAEDRLGPYSTREAAEDALATLAQRQKQWDEDPRFVDPDLATDADEWDRSSRGWGPFRS